MTKTEGGDERAIKTIRLQNLYSCEMRDGGGQQGLMVLQYTSISMNCGAPL